MNNMEKFAHSSRRNEWVNYAYEKKNNNNVECNALQRKLWHRAKRKQTTNDIQTHAAAAANE